MGVTTTVGTLVAVGGMVVAVGGTVVAVGGTLVAVLVGWSTIAVDVCSAWATTAALVRVACAKRATWVAESEGEVVGCGKLHPASKPNNNTAKTIFFIFPRFLCHHKQMVISMTLYI